MDGPICQKEYKIYSIFIVHGIYTFVRDLPFYNEREDKDELELDPERSWRRRPQLLFYHVALCGNKTKFRS